MVCFQFGWRTRLTRPVCFRIESTHFGKIAGLCFSFLQAKDEPAHCSARVPPHAVFAEHGGGENQDHSGRAVPATRNSENDVAPHFHSRPVIPIVFLHREFTSKDTEGPPIFFWPEVCASLFGLPPVERCPSGLRSTLGKRVSGKLDRGFESHPLRHIFGLLFSESYT